MGVQYFRGIFSFARINRSGIRFVLYFILSPFYFLVICTNFPFILVPTGDILMSFLQSRVCNSEQDTAAAVADPASNTPGRAASFVVRYLLGDR